MCNILQQKHACMWCVWIQNFSFLIKACSFFWFSFISFPAHHVSVVLLPAAQMYWINTKDGGGRVRPFSMKPALGDTLVVQMVTQDLVAFLKCMHQLQGQKLSRWKQRGSVLRRYRQFPASSHSSIRASPDTCRKHSS